MWSDKACILGCFTKPVDRELVDIHQALVPQGKFMEMRMFTSQIWRVCQETYRVLKQHIFFAMSIVSYIILDGKQVTFFLAVMSISQHGIKKGNPLQDDPPWPDACFEE